MKLAAVLVLVVACTPDLADETSLVTEPRVLAVRTEPAEAAPGATVTFEALVADPDGVVATAPLSWAFCAARKPFTEPGPISPACLDATSDQLTAFGTGITATGTLPADGCRVFGPDRPDPMPGEPAGRPTDPDGTGGYFAPVLVTGTGSATLAQARIRCALPAATPAQASEFLATYQPNVNPVIDHVAIERGGAETPLTALASEPAAVASVPAGEDVHLVVHWADADAEPYVWFDPARHVLAMRREAMRVSWFVTAGSVDSGHSGRAETDLATSAEDHWLAPDTAGTALVWIVLRDDRGGTTWASYRFAVGASARVLTPRM